MRMLMLALSVLVVLTGSAPFVEDVAHAATCVGADPCNACKNCKYCKRCSKDGGTCGVCRRVESVSGAGAHPDDLC